MLYDQENKAIVVEVGESKEFSSQDSPDFFGKCGRESELCGREKVGNFDGDFKVDQNEGLKLVLVENPI